MPGDPRYAGIRRELQEIRDQETKRLEKATTAARVAVRRFRAQVSAPRMVACALSIRQCRAGVSAPVRPPRSPPLPSPLLVTKKRVTDLLPPIGIDAGAALRAVSGVFSNGGWTLVSHIVRLLTGRSRPAAGTEVSRVGGNRMLRVTVAIVFAFFMRAADIAQAAHPIYPPDYIVYVCGIKEGQLKTYLNVYFARNDGATQIRPGRCEAQQYRR
jgi:hypothetical protein